MSRLRRLFVSDKIFFITCNVRRDRLPFMEAEFELLARAFAEIRGRRGFLLAGYVFMPNYWHALIYLVKTIPYRG